MTRTLEDLGDMLPLEQVARQVGIKAQSLRLMAQRREFPQIMRITARRFRVSKREVEQWLQGISNPAVAGSIPAGRAILGLARTAEKRPFDPRRTRCGRVVRAALTTARTAGSSWQQRSSGEMLP